MKEYSFNVSRDGQFLFRTDWDWNMDRVLKAEQELCKAFRSADGYRVSRTCREIHATSTELTT